MREATRAEHLGAHALNGTVGHRAPPVEVERLVVPWGRQIQRVKRNWGKDKKHPFWTLLTISSEGFKWLFPRVKLNTKIYHLQIGPDFETSKFSITPVQPVPQCKNFGLHLASDSSWVKIGGHLALSGHRKVANAERYVSFGHQKYLYPRVVKSYFYPRAVFRESILGLCRTGTTKVYWIFKIRKMSSNFQVLSFCIQFNPW